MGTPNTKDNDAEWRAFTLCEREVARAACVLLDRGFDHAAIASALSIPIPAGVKKQARLHALVMARVEAATWTVPPDRWQRRHG